MPNSRQGLWNALDFRLSEILRYDFFLGLAGGIGAAYIEARSPAQLDLAVDSLISLIGIVIGAVVAGVAVQAAFLDEQFLRKLEGIGKDPVRYMAPFLFTALLGVAAGISLVLAGAVPDTAVVSLRVIIAGMAGWLSVWTLVSVIPDLDMLVQFVRLQVDAAQVEAEAIPRLHKAEENDG